MAVDGEHPASAQQLGAGNGELAHRAAPEHRHGVAAAHLGHLGAEVAGGEDVREQNRLIVADLRWQFDQPDVGERDTGLLSLQTMEWSGGLRTAIERGAGLLAVRVGAIALGEVAGPAVGTVATGDGGWDDDPIADLQVAHIGAQGLDDADTFVAENGARLHAAHGAPHEVQVGAADRRCGDAHNGIGGRQDAWFRHVFETDIANGVVDNSFHGHSIGPARGPGRMLAERTSRLHGGKEDRRECSDRRLRGILEYSRARRDSPGTSVPTFPGVGGSSFSGAASSMRRGLAAI